jgi:hypothetical protein
MTTKINTETATACFFRRRMKDELTGFAFRFGLIGLLLPS